MWYFTFGTDNEKKDYIIRINESDYYKARERMFELYGGKWCWQYDQQKGEELIERYNYKVIEGGI